MNKNKKYISDMLYLQSSFNTNTCEKWEIKQLDWATAIFIEAGEAIDSFNWKWWKHGGNDLANLTVEMVDLWHFIMSYMLENESFKETFDNILNYADYILVNRSFKYPFNKIFQLVNTDSTFAELNKNGKSSEDVIKTYSKEIREIAISIARDDINSALDAFFNVWNGLGHSFEYLYDCYVVKNCLNKFRQDHGYKDGTYVKHWAVDDLPENDVEDNAVASMLIKYNTDSNDVMTTFYADLQKAYDESNKLIAERIQS